MMIKAIKKFFLGAPLPSSEYSHQRLSKKVGLAVFSSDALSSTAYATEEILLVLMLIGPMALTHSLPIALAILLLLFILISSYSETIHAYPNGGGAYVVSKENLGKHPSLIAGAALLIDYVLTVSVSAASGVGALTSAVPSLKPYSVSLCLIGILFITLANLRGVKESGAFFSVPTYLFICSIFLLLGVGFYQYVFIPHETPVLVGTPVIFSDLPYFILLKAFSSGCAALTGVEAISNGTPAFRAPESRNANITLVWMGLILGLMFFGITELARLNHIIPNDHETVVSQIARDVFKGGVFYYLIQISTALILFIAANTAFADFPRLASLLARDGYLPRQLSSLGDRLAFSNGIVILGFASGFLVVVFSAQTHSLIPLYAVGVFISFTLSQAGMVVHWFKLKAKFWVPRALLNGLGAMTTGLATVVIAITKFTHGAFVVLIIIPLMVLMFLKIKRHYSEIVDQLSPEAMDLILPRKHLVLVPLSTFHKGTIKSLTYAQSISSEVRALYISMDAARASTIKDIWSNWGIQIPLVILETPYRSVIQPLISYIDLLQREDPSQLVTVVLPEFVPAKWWQQILHNQTALLIRGTLMFKKGVVVTTVRHFLEY